MDPSAGEFAPTGDMNMARGLHTATFLPDGTVLVTGGGTPIGPLAIVLPRPISLSELYDPLSGTWSLTGDLNAARSWHSATLLGDGRVLVTGGAALQRELAQAIAEIYDSPSGVWSAVSSMEKVRIRHTSTLLRDGRVLVAGGGEGEGPRARSHASVEIFDPISGDWTMSTSPP